MGVGGESQKKTDPRKEYDDEKALCAQ